jgi:hypothetical protein
MSTDKWTLFPSHTNRRTAKLVGGMTVKGGSRWLSIDGTERLVRDTLSGGTPTAPDASLTTDEVMGQPSRVLDGCVLSDAEVLSVPVHLADGSVADTRKLFTNGPTLAAAMRNRRDFEAIVVQAVTERGLPTLTEHKAAARRRIHDAVLKALTTAE